MARERAKKLQTELESSQKDVGLTLKYRHEKESLELENMSLQAANDTLRQQYNDLLASKKSLTAQHSKLSRDFEAAQDELATVREELQNIRLEFDILQEEKVLIAEDHASLERNNETYFKENKSLRAKIASQDHRIHDLEKGVASRDQLIDALQTDVTRTTDAAGLHEHYAKLEREIEKLKQRLQQQDAVSRKKDEAIAALEEENERLDTDRKQMEDEWVSDRHKNIRLNQALMKNETRYLKHINDHNDECERREEQCKQIEAALAQKESTLAEKAERRTAAINKVKQLTKEITNLSLPDISTKPAKMTRIVEPSNVTAGKYAESEQTAKSDEFPVQDDPTTRINLTQGSDFASIFTDEEIPKLKETLRYLRQSQQQQSAEEASAAGNTIPTIDCELPSLPVPIMRRTRSDETVTHKLNKPAGILKKTSHVMQDDEFTGRFSVKSGVSVVSMQSNQSGRSAQSHKSAKSIASVQLPHLNPLRHRRSQSDNARFDTELLTEQNMTSAFFVPDITLHSENQVTGEQSGPSLSKDARRVLDSVCKHKSRNCTVCTRISAHAKKSGCAAEGSRKKTVRVQKPVPVTDRMPEPGQYEEEPTMRPSMPPGHALAIVIKEIEDEIQHLEIALLNKNRLYCSLDKSLGQRERKRVMDQIRQLQRELESKSAMMYKLHDVLEGQKVAGQVMTDAELEVTIASICGHEATGEQRVDDSWNGFD